MHDRSHSKWLLSRAKRSSLPPEGKVGLLVYGPIPQPRRLFCCSLFKNRSPKRTSMLSVLTCAHIRRLSMWLAELQCLRVLLHFFSRGVHSHTRTIRLRQELDGIEGEVKGGHRFLSMPISCTLRPNSLSELELRHPRQCQSV